MTAERLPRFVPSSVDHRYRVTLLCNKWDTDEGKFTDTITAIGPIGARQTAEDKWRHEYPAICAVHVEEIVLDPDFHEECGYRWDRHNNRIKAWKGPFGCPSELDLRVMDGER